MIVGCTLKMRTSSEIITVSKRAAKASGFSWGVSAFVVAVIAEEMYNAAYGEEDAHGHH